MKILFVKPDTSIDSELKLDQVKSSSPSLGLLSLAAIARENGHEVKYLDSVTDPPDGYCDILALTAMTCEMDHAIQIAQKVKKQSSKAKIVIGGPHVSALPYETSMTGLFDHIFTGEGEWQFLNWLGNDTSKYQSLDDLPFPAFDLVNLRKYRLSQFGTKEDLSVGLVTSRGCFGKCTFCSQSIFGHKFRYHSARYVIELMKDLNIKYGVKDFLFYDDLFVGNKKRLVEFCKIRHDERLPFTWSCCARVDTVDSKTLDLMKASGCWMIEYGIESGSQRILDSIKKNVSINKIREAISDTKKAGILSKGNFILGHIEETHDSINETIQLACQLSLDYAQHTFMAPLPGTEDYERANRFGTFDKDWRKCSTFLISYVPNGFTKEELMDYSRKFWRRFYLRPRIIFKQFSRLSFKRLINAIKVFLRVIFE